MKRAAASPPPTPTPISKHSRFLAAWWGAFIGDALAMPVHGYYKRESIGQDYGEFDAYVAPKNPHPDSILWRSRYESENERDNILHDQAAFWGKPGIHYHQCLQPGENTLNARLAAVLAESLIENRGYSPEDYLSRYLDFMLTPGKHRDTYIEECHRGFFKHYGRGKAPEKCGVEDSHISCLATLTPLVLFYHRDREALVFHVRRHLSLLHNGETAARAGELFALTLHYLLAGDSFEAVIFERIGRTRFQALTFPLRRWVENHEEAEVVGKIVSPGGYLEDALPATYFLALKYQDDFERGLLRNTRLGGDNCHRGVALGSILGASQGCEEIPRHWVGDLKDRERYDALGDRLWEAAGD